MQPINIEMVRDRARGIRENLEKIRTYVSQSNDDFFSDERNLYTVMHLLLTSIEAAASICNHLMAKTAGRAPASYSECFEGLQELDILDEALTERLTQMVRFRNILVNRYWQIEPERVLGYARENLEDFEGFLLGIGQFVGKQL